MSFAELSGCALGCVDLCRGATFCTAPVQSPEKIELFRSLSATLNLRLKVRFLAAHFF